MILLRRPRTIEEKRKIGISRQSREVLHLEFDEECKGKVKTEAGLKTLCSGKDYQLNF